MDARLIRAVRQAQGAGQQARGPRVPVVAGPALRLAPPMGALGQPRPDPRVVQLIQKLKADNQKLAALLIVERKRVVALATQVAALTGRPPPRVQGSHPQAQVRGPGPAQPAQPSQPSAAPMAGEVIVPPKAQASDDLTEIYLAGMGDDWEGGLG